MNLARQHLDIKVKVHVGKIIDALRENKLKHIEEYKDAVEGFFYKLRTEAERLLDDHANRDLKAVQLYMLPPIDARAMYDEYIKMLSLAQDPVIEISTDEYACFFEDKWDWAQSAKLANSTYSSFRG